MARDAHAQRDYITLWSLVTAAPRAAQYASHTGLPTPMYSLDSPRKRRKSSPAFSNRSLHPGASLAQAMSRLQPRGDTACLQYSIYETPARENPEADVAGWESKAMVWKDGIALFKFKFKFKYRTTIKFAELLRRAEPNVPLDLPLLFGTSAIATCSGACGEIGGACGEIVNPDSISHGARMFTCRRIFRRSCLIGAFSVVSACRSGTGRDTHILLAPCGHCGEIYSPRV
jgi:hypothetical protein